MLDEPAYLLDADTVIDLHSLGLIDALSAGLTTKAVVACCTRYVWEHELSALEPVRRKLERAGLAVHEVAPKSPAGVTFRDLLKERGNPGRSSRGELNLIAFATHHDQPLALVARDEGARRAASRHGLPAIDLGDFICDLVLLGCLVPGSAREAVACWDLPDAGNGRPRGFAGSTRCWPRGSPRGPRRNASAADRDGLRRPARTSSGRAARTEWLHEP